MSSTGTSTRSRQPSCASARRRSRPAAASSAPPRPPTSPPPSRRAISSSGRCVAESPMRWSGRRRAARSASSRSSERKRCAPRLVGDHRVDLVDDHRLDRREDGPRARRQQQVERLRRRDQDVRRRRGAIRARSRAGRVPGADRHGRDPDARRRARSATRGDAGDRRAQVALDVDGERLERRDVEDAAALGLGGLGREHQPVDRREEGRQRLARAGRREQQRGAPAQDRRPAFFLGRRGPGEGRAKPFANRRRESGERLFRHPRILCALCAGLATRPREKRAAPEGCRPSQDWPAVRPTACAWA